ncbi:MAG: MBL fold metallo-hydrolase [Thermaerobacter sp.]|nr:MBL fold metallo-hydrolase [Thermaerobacter sp.]
MAEYESAYFRIQELAEGVWAALAKAGQGAWSNAGIVDLGRSTLVVDAMFTPAAGAALREAAEHLTRNPVRWLVLTHRDHDHVLGSQAFQGVAIVATRTTADCMRDRTGAFLQTARREGARWLTQLEREARAQVDPYERTQRRAVRGEYQALIQNIERITPARPSLMADENLTIYGQRREVQILSFGGVHTESDSVVYLPEERILFSGDIVQVGHHPAVRHGTPTHWPGVVRQVADLEADIVLSGHGPVGAREDVLLAERYYFELPEWANGAPVPEPFASWDAPQTLVENLRYAQNAMAQ